MFSGLLQRKENARQSFLDCAQQNGLTADEAQSVLAYYLKHKLVKLGANDGQFHVKSGNLMETDTMRQALSLSEK